MQMTQWIVFLPVNFNDGTAVPDKVLAGLERSLCQRFGGVTIPPVGEGMWINDRRESFRDKVKVIQVLTPSSDDADRFMASFGEQIKNSLRQEMVLMVSSLIDTISITGDALKSS